MTDLPSLGGNKKQQLAVRNNDFDDFGFGDNSNEDDSDKKQPSKISGSKYSNNSKA